MRWEQLTREQEHARLMKEYQNAPFEQVMVMLERQFSVLHNRSQLLLTLCGIIITTTGFSGRNIAGTNLAGQVLIVAGVSFSLLSAAVVVWRVLHLHWLSAQVGEDRATWLMRALTYRDLKTSGYRWGIILLLIGLTFYVAAIAVMLLHPR